MRIAFMTLTTVAGGGFLYGIGAGVGTCLAFVGFSSLGAAGVSCATGVIKMLGSQRDEDSSIAEDNQNREKGLYKTKRLGTAAASLVLTAAFSTVAVKSLSVASVYFKAHFKALSEQSMIEEKKRKAANEEANTIKINCSGKISREFYKADAGRDDLKVELPKGCIVVRKLKVEGCCR